MNNRRVFHISILLAVLAVGMFVVCSCTGRKEMSNNVIVQNDVFTMTGDSIIEDTVIAWCPSPGRIESNLTLSRLDSLYGDVDSSRVSFAEGKHWQLQKKRPVMMPEYSSDQMLVDALYAMSADHIAGAVDKYGRFAPFKNNYSRLYCSIYLSLAALKPHQSMETLRSIVDSDSIIMQIEGQWPVVSDHIGWATAAWEVYKVTGDRNWLNYCYHVVSKTLAINSEVLIDQQTGLVHGAGYTASRPLGERRMTWMGYNELFACMSLGNNILTGNAYALLADMGDELGIENAYQREAKRIKDAINQNLWNEKKAFYSSFLYGVAYPRQSPLTDNTSQAMCVLWGIADDDRAENLIAHTPVSDLGVNVTYPTTNTLEPFFANSSWATTQALWNLAAVTVGNENALRRGLGALYRAQALYQSRGIHLQGIETDNLGTGASNAAMILRVLMGLNFTPDGIEFAPMVPTCMTGTKTLKGLLYRKAIIDITIYGSGTDIKSITDNGRPLEGTFLPGDIDGNHHIEITLEPRLNSSQYVTIHKGEVILPATPEVVWGVDSGHVVGYTADTRYILTVNGQQTALSDSVFALPHSDTFAEYSVEIAGKYGVGFMSRPWLRFGLTPQIAFFPDSSDGDTTITVSVAHGGDYLLDVGYRPTGSLDVRRVSANTHPMGTLVMAGQVEPQEDGLAYSNMIIVTLLKGENTLEFDQIRLPKSFTTCQPVHVRIIQR